MHSSADLEKAYQHCDEIARQRARNFYPAFRILPKSRRLALSAFYAFCSLSDDIADDSYGLTAEEKLEKLNKWRSTLDSCLGGEADSPLFIALKDTIRRYELPQKPFYDLLDGIEMDFNVRKYQTFDELEDYCRKVASSVGLVSVRIFGCSNDGADEYAETLGIAFQLTNIIRDVSEDLQHKRIYLPQEDMRRFSYSDADLRDQIYDQRFVALMQYQYERAISYFQRARPELAGAQAKNLLTAEIMKDIYYHTLQVVKRQNFDVFSKRISISKSKMITAIAAALLRRLIPSPKFDPTLRGT